MATKVADLFGQLSLRTDRASFSLGSKLIDGIAIGLGTKIVEAAASAARAIPAMFTEVANRADEFNKMALKVGIASEALQELEFAAGLGGTSISVLRTGIQRFARTISDSQRGLKEAKDALADAGLEAQNADGSFRATEDLLISVADTFARMPDGVEKTALAMRLFGRSGAELIPLLNQGSEAIAEQRAEFRELGGVITTEEGRSFEKLNDDMLRVKTTIQGLKQRLVVALLPAVQRVTTAVLEWFKANRRVIVAGLQAVVEGIGTALRTAWEILGPILSMTRELVANVFELFGGWEAIRASLKGVGIVITSQIKLAKDLLGWVLKISTGMQSAVEGMIDFLGLRGELFGGEALKGVRDAQGRLDQRNFEEAVDRRTLRGDYRLGLPPGTFKSKPAQVDARAAIRTTINVTPEMDAREVEARVTKTMREEFKKQARQLAAELEEDDD